MLAYDGGPVGPILPGSIMDRSFSNTCELVLGRSSADKISNPEPHQFRSHGAARGAQPYHFGLLCCSRRTHVRDKLVMVWMLHVCSNHVGQVQRTHTMLVRRHIPLDGV